MSTVTKLNIYVEQYILTNSQYVCSVYPR